MVVYLTLTWVKFNEGNLTSK